MPERRGSVGPIEIPDYSKQPAVVGDLIVAESSYQHALVAHSQARASLATERKNLASLQLETAHRADTLIADILAFSYAAFDYESMGHRHPQIRGMASSPVRHTNSASREYVIDDNGQAVVYVVSNRRVVQTGRIVEESLIISKANDYAFRLSMTVVKSGRNSERKLDLRDGRGWQHLVQGSVRQKWHAMQHYNPGHEADYTQTDVLSSFRWFMDRLHSPLQAGEIEEIEDQVI